LSYQCLVSFFCPFLSRASREDSLTYQSNVGIEVFGGVGQTPYNATDTTWPILDVKYLDNHEVQFGVDPGPGPYLPMWQQSPLVTTYINVNFLALDVTKSYVNDEPLIAYHSNRAVSTAFKNITSGRFDDVPITATNYYAGFLSTQAGQDVYYEGSPISDLLIPIARSFVDNTTDAILIAVLNWMTYFKDLLPANARDIVVVLDDSCTGPSTLIVRGNQVVFQGKGDLHDTNYNAYVTKASWETVDVIQDGTELGLPYLTSHCPPSIHIYPTLDYEKQFNYNQAIYMTVTVFFVFLFAICVFVAYDRLVERRQNLVLTKALQSGAIVSSLFPEKIAERLLQQQNTTHPEDPNYNTKWNSTNQRLRSFVAANGGPYRNHNTEEAPIADLFPNATVYFADIAGFTAWSSTREPVQVFILLQHLYQAFDHIAHRRKVFKVETIGDCYVAVTGCPERQDQHPIIMARFATDCQRKMIEVIGTLSVTLGPDTSGR
jgi:Adenylate and Guanylate cyclase catalytic domain